MSLEQVFEHDILAHPDDDTPRLVYADWLDEHDDEPSQARAKLIRLQCAAERLPANDPQRRESERQARAIVRQHGKRWTEPLRKAKLGRNWKFHRGFVAELTMSPTEFVADAEQLFSLAPIQRVNFPEAANELSELVLCPHLARLRKVDLTFMCFCGFCPIHEELSELFASPFVTELDTLILDEDRISGPLLQQLMNSPQLRSLRTLVLDGNGFATAGARVVASGTVTAQLKSLSLAANDIGLQGARALGKSPALAGLTTLNLSDNSIADVGAMALAQSPHLAGLTMLDVRYNEIEEKGAKALRERFGKRVKVRG